MMAVRSYKTKVVQGALLLAAWTVVGCNMSERPAGRRVGDAWEEPASPPSDQSDDWDASEADSSGMRERTAALPIATVNQRPISRKRLFGLLLRTHGMKVLGQLIALEVVRQSAEAEGIAVTPADIRVEYDRALLRISSPVPAATQPNLGEAAREMMLTEMLARRGLTREEFNLAMERQAYLRKLAVKRLKITDEQFRAQYEMMYDERVQVRHIQVSALRDVGPINRLLEAGRDFTEVAKFHSRNPRTSANGGLLPPFSRNQDDVPPQLREAAFKLELGQVSSAIRIGRDYHLVKPVKRFEKSKVKFEHVKEIVRVKLTERLLPELMDRIEKELVEQARKQIVITDPVLRKQFEERYQPGPRAAAGGGT